MAAMRHNAPQKNAMVAPVLNLALLALLGFAIIGCVRVWLAQITVVVFSPGFAEGFPLIRVSVTGKMDL
jgi:hypothetical protein